MSGLAGKSDTSLEGIRQSRIAMWFGSAQRIRGSGGLDPLGALFGEHRLKRRVKAAHLDEALCIRSVMTHGPRVLNDAPTMASDRR